MWSSGRREWPASAAGDHADDFDAIAVGQRRGRPLRAQECGAVVLDEGGGQREAEFGHKFLHLRRVNFPFAAVEKQFHGQRMA